MGWFRTLLSGRPHLVIGDPADPYMLRWFLVPKNRRLNLFLHQFVRDDDDRALHDHPWWFVSLVLWGSYREALEFKTPGVAIDEWYLLSWPRRTVERRWLSVAFRRPTDRHQVTLPKRTDGTARPCWTLVLTGPKVREWGFWCPKGFVPWQEFVKPHARGEVGRGCE